MESNRINSDVVERLRRYLNELYAEEDASDLLQQLIQRIETHFSLSAPTLKHIGPLSHRDAILIAYPDHVQEEGSSSLATLQRFLNTFLSDKISGVHILPFFPSSSDDGFSIIDYFSVNSRVGDWPEVLSIALEYRLMIDLVINHVSSQSKWFKGFLASVEPYDDYFISLAPDTDLSMVVRPRDLPLLTSFDTLEGQEYVWTTFSPDQVDLNFANPAVLLEIMDVLLHYIQNGAQIIRLDAIAFLWKQPGNPSIHLPQTHTVVKLLRQVLTIVAPWVHIVTETNVPHKENVSYFGNGQDEAHLVYQFALPPLVLHSLASGDATAITQWASNLDLPSKTTTFLNYLASHDGIGLRPAQDVLDQKSLQRLLDWTIARNGKISYRSVGENQSEPYELNITLFDILADETAGETPSAVSIDRYLAAQAIMLSLKGVPGIYFHSLFGGRNHSRGVEDTGMNRTINREKFQLDNLEHWLKDPAHYSSKVFSRFCQLLHARQNHRAFNPYGIQDVLDLHPSTFTLLRTSPDDGSKVLCVHNVSARVVELQDFSPKISAAGGFDILNQEPINSHQIRLLPYQCRWITLYPSV